MKQLTITQALEQGYEYCGYSGETFQRLILIEDLENSQMKDNLVLAEIESFSPTTNGDDLKDLIADYMQQEWTDATYDDDNQVYDSVKEMDFSKIADKINKKLSPIWNRLLTPIKLIAGDDRCKCDNCDDLVLIDDLSEYEYDKSLTVCNACYQELNGTLI